MKQFTAILSACMMLAAAEAPVAPLGVYTAAERRHWAFQPRKDPTPPAFTAAADKAWVKTPIDAFLLAGLKKAGLRPAPAADRATLIRRVTFDLTGLPPTPEEIDAFVRDQSANAWEKVVDRLLASPHYGEQWGRHWLDVVRFAESDGYEYDMHRPDAWRYRDYVVESFNRDKPYTEFVKEQLAGDEIDAKNPALLVASGFNRLGPLRKNAGNQDVASSHNEVLTEMTNIVGAAFLGVTVGCARCHDHKFDPFRQSDYYRLQAHFAQTQPNDVVLASKEEQAEWKVKATPLEQERRRLQMQLRRAPDGEKAKLELQLEELDDKMPAPLASIYSVTDEPKKASPIQILFHGDYLNPVAKVGVRPLGILLPEGEPEAPIDTEQPRLKLAEWITDAKNPLTARVMVNRVWQYHFGRRPGFHAERFRTDGHAAFESGTAGLAGQPVCGRRMAHQAATSHDPAVECVPAVQHLADGEGGDGKGLGERAAVEVQPSPAGGGGTARRHAGGCRAAEFEGRRTELHGADRSGPGAQSEAPAVLGGDARQIRVRSPHVVHDLQTQSAAAVRRSVRCAGHAAFLRAARAIDARSAGAGVVERADLERSGGGFRESNYEGADRGWRRESITPGVWPRGGRRRQRRGRWRRSSWPGSLTIRQGEGICPGGI